MLRLNSDERQLSMRCAQYTGPESVPAIEAMGLVNYGLMDDGTTLRMGWPKPDDQEFAGQQPVALGQWIVLRDGVNSYEVFDTEADFRGLPGTELTLEKPA